MFRASKVPTALRSGRREMAAGETNGRPDRGEIFDARQVPERGSARARRTARDSRAPRSGRVVAMASESGKPRRRWRWLLVALLLPAVALPVGCSMLSEFKPAIDTPQVRRTGSPSGERIFQRNSAFPATRFAARIGSSTEASDMIDDSGRTTMTTATPCSGGSFCGMAKMSNLLRFLSN